MKHKQVYSKKCRLCNKEHLIEAHEQDINKFFDGVNAQIALPYLTPGERELIISGTCDDCWTNLFGSDDADPEEGE